MKIAVTATGKTLDSSVDPRFGRCPCFLIVETDDLGLEVVDNPNVTLGGGAGIQSAQLMADRGVTHVLTGNCGPNAHQTLSAAGVAVIVGCSGSVRQVIEQFKAGRLAPVGEPNVASHFGMGGGADPGADVSGGRGAGRGGGRGAGDGFGRGRRQGSGMGYGGGLIVPPDGCQGEAEPQDELTVLKEQAELLGQQAQQIQKRIAELEKEKNRS